MTRRWQRAWPPSTLVLIPVFTGGTLALGLSVMPMVAKVLLFTVWHPDRRY